MGLRLVVIAGPDKGKVFPLSAAEPLVVGRSQTTSTKLTDPHCSKVHCQIILEGEHVSIVDQNSTGGTFVNEKKVQQCGLRPGDVIRVGSTQFKLIEDDPGDATLPPAGPTVASPAPGPAKPVLTDNLNDLVGQTLAHFEIGPILGKGQKGITFRARDTKDGTEVALKVMKPDFAKNEEDMQRFIRGMKTMMPLRHPNLVTIYGAGKTGPYCWISQELVEGESLTQVIQRIGTAGMLDWRHALRVAVHVGRALEYAQQHQIIHRNITPQNIMVRSSDKLTKLGDMMLAKALEGTQAKEVTGAGTLVGDVRYMSPERTTGSADVDCRSDIYCLGATVYALLTGRPPFEGSSLIETITRIRTAEPVKPKKFQLSIPDLFEGVVLKMLAKRPEERYQTATEMLKELEKVARFQGVQL